MMCGIVDLGSNTVRLSIYRYGNGDFQRLLNEKAMVGLAGYVKDGALSDSGIRAACRVLAAYRALLSNFGVEDMRVFATASLRNITNTHQALDTIGRETGIHVEILTGEMEAALSFRGAVGPEGPASGLVTDIGGGSVELVGYKDRAITSACSLPMGSLSLYTKYVDGLFPTAEESRVIRDYVAGELEKAKTAGLVFPYLCGVGGTIRAVSRLCNDVFQKPAENSLMEVGEVDELYHRLKAGDRATLRQILHTTPDRVHTILPGLIILNTVVRSYGVETVEASPSGVREGYFTQRVMGQ